MSVQWSPHFDNYFASSSNDGTVVIWDINAHGVAPSLPAVDGDASAASGAAAGGAGGSSSASAPASAPASTSERRKRRRNSASDDGGKSASDAGHGAEVTFVHAGHRCVCVCVLAWECYGALQRDVCVVRSPGHM